MTSDSTRTPSSALAPHGAPTHDSARRAVLAVLLSGIGLVHLLDLPGKWEETRWMGIAYLGLIASAVVVAEMSLRVARPVIYLLAAGLAAGPMAGFVATRTTGLPGAHDDIGNWSEPLGLASLFIEAMVLVLAAAALATTPRTVTDDRETSADVTAQPLAGGPAVPEQHARTGRLAGSSTTTADRARP